MSRVIKKELINEVSNTTGIKQQDVTQVVESFLEGVMKHLGSGEVVALRDFGTFDLRVLKGKIGRNPKRPEIPIHIPERHAIRFIPAGKLKDLVTAVPVKPLVE